MNKQHAQQQLQNQQAVIESPKMKSVVDAKVKQKKKQKELREARKRKFNMKYANGGGKRIIMDHMDDSPPLQIKQKNDSAPKPILQMSPKRKRNSRQLRFDDLTENNSDSNSNDAVLTTERGLIRQRRAAFPENSTSSLQTDTDLEDESALEDQNRKSFNRAGSLLKKGNTLKRQNNSQRKLLNERRKSEHGKDRKSLQKMVHTRDKKKNQKYKVISKETQELVKANKKNPFLKRLNHLNKNEQFISQQEYQEYCRQSYNSLEDMDHDENMIQQKWLISYQNINCRRLDLLTSILVLYDIIVVPFSLSYGNEKQSVLAKFILKVIDVVIKIIFSFDIVIGFRKTYMEKSTGKQITDSKKIAIHYLQFHFWFDFIACVPFEYITDNIWLRILGLVKVIRLFRINHIMIYLGFSTKQRARMSIAYLFIILITIIHWINCYFYRTIILNYTFTDDMINQPNADPSLYTLIENNSRKPVFKFNFWIPQVDLIDSETEYYDLSSKDQYIIMFYYIILLVLGNDINPQTNQEIVNCTWFLFIGAILESVIFGGISAEMSKALDKHKDCQDTYDYMEFSLKLNHVHPEIQCSVYKYLETKEDSADIRAYCTNELDDCVNYSIIYDVTYYLYFDKLISMWMFQNQTETEILYIAHRIEPRLFISGEHVIYQDDEPDYMYMIFRGSVRVYINLLKYDQLNEEPIATNRDKKKFQKLLTQNKRKSFQDQLKDKLMLVVQKSALSAERDNESDNKSDIHEEVILPQRTFQHFLQYKHQLGSRNKFNAI